jgi:site-specific DNA recombinase
MAAIAIYTRLSQVRDGISEPVKRQEADCRRLAEARGWDGEIRVYTDLDLSAWKGVRRPKFEDLLADIDAGEVGTVIVWRLDRLVRSPREFEVVLDVIGRTGTRLVSFHESFDTASPAGLFLARMLANLARMESDGNSIRIRSAKEQAARQGKPKTGGARPFGWMPDLVTPHAEEAQVLQELADRVLAGQPLRHAVAEVNRQQGLKLATMNMRRALISPRIVGAREHRGEIVAWDAWEAILDRATWERLRMVLPAWNKRGRPAKYLLAGLLRCGRCGERLHSRTGGNVDRDTYACKPRPEHIGCGKLSVSAAAVERVVVGDLMTALDSDRLAELLSRHDTEQDLQVAGRLDQLEGALEELSKDFYVRRAISRPEFFAARDDLVRQIEQANARRARRVSRGVLESLPGSREELEAQWDGWDLDRKRTVLAAFIDHVVVHPTATRGRRFDTNRVEIIWRS